jgi:hypothetical protein
MLPMAAERDELVRRVTASISESLGRGRGR